MVLCLKSLRAALAACVVVIVAGCGSAERNLASNAALSGGLRSMTVTSPAFKNREPIPQKYTQDGENISPPLRWSSGPSGTSQYVLIVEDPDAGRKKPAVHWLVYHIPAGTTELPENAAAAGGLTQGKNFTGQVGYVGPKVSKGNSHRYYFQIFAVDPTFTIPPGVTREELEKAALHGALAKGSMIGTYGK
jgi:Raf kinase inhibitor-like YbhB/YbcL family protein